MLKIQKNKKRNVSADGKETHCKKKKKITFETIAKEPHHRVLFVSPCHLMRKKTVKGKHWVSVIVRLNMYPHVILERSRSDRYWHGKQNKNKIKENKAHCGMSTSKGR